MAKIKCSVCNKKINEFTKYDCSKCNAVLCLSHLNASLHNCTFDYKNKFKDILIKQNPVIIKEKVPDKLE